MPASTTQPERDRHATSLVVDPVTEVVADVVRIDEVSWGSKPRGLSGHPSSTYRDPIGPTPGPTEEWTMGICDGRVAIVTGAGRGIGREHALLLAKEGAMVVVNDLGGAPDGVGIDLTPAQQVVAEIEAMGGAAIANGDDVSSWSGAEHMVKEAVDTFGDLHVLVNNAGILRDRMLVNMTEAEWDAVIQVHLKGTFAPALCCSRQ